MLIAYPYIPAIYDLWLYEDHEISWTFPDPSSMIVKRPYAWNPTSLMYGYRKSVQAIPAVYRLMNTPAGAMTYGANSAADPINRPVFYNSYVPWKSYAFGRRTLIQCEHWQTSLTYRDPTKNYGNIFTSGSFFIASTLVRWIAHDNSVFDATPSDMLQPYKKVPVAFGNGWANGSTGENDVAITECAFDIPVAPLKMIDARTVPFGAKAFTLDSNFKIAELKWIGCGYQVGSPTSFAFRTEYVQQAGETDLPLWFSHDSGSTVFVELKPPTSAEAGDGILALVMYSLESGSNLLYGYPAYFALIPREEHATNMAVAYQESLGNDFPISVPYMRQNIEGIATQTRAQEILSAANQLITIAES
jgi:hypothetical protein